jgi:AraC-like DNA-binding protein
MKKNEEIWNNLNNADRGVYRYDSTLQAGTSNYVFQKDRLHKNICDKFLGFSYVLVGQGAQVRLDGRRTPFFPGCIIIRHPNMVTHSFQKQGHYIDKFLCLPSTFYNLFIEYNLFSPEQDVIEIGINMDVALSFDNFVEELESASEMDLPVIMAKIYQFLVHILLSRNTQKTKYLEELTLAAQMLENNLEEQVSLKEIAKLLNISYPHFRRLFQAYYQIPPGEYRIRKRIEKAQQLLRNRSLSIKEVALKFNYADLYTFSKQFKKYTGLSPRVFSRKFN